jgi:hypothetical protein
MVSTVGAVWGGDITAGFIGGAASAGGGGSSSAGHGMQAYLHDQQCALVRNVIEIATLQTLLSDLSAADRRDRRVTVNAAFN